jgi:hypothetical protein
MKKLLIFFAGIAIALIVVAATSVKSTRLISELTVSEELTTASIDQVIKHNNLNEIINFRPTSDTVTTDVDNVYSAELTSGSSIDLTSLTNTLGNSLDLTGERIVAIKFKNSSTTGSNAINVTEGASNAYPLLGSTYSFDLQPRQSLLYKADTMLTDVDASNLQIDYTLNGDTLGIILISAELY